MTWWRLTTTALYFMAVVTWLLLQKKKMTFRPIAAETLTAKPRVCCLLTTSHIPNPFSTLNWWTGQFQTVITCPEITTTRWENVRLQYEAAVNRTPYDFTCCSSSIYKTFLKELGLGILWNFKILLYKFAYVLYNHGYKWYRLYSASCSLVVS